TEAQVATSEAALVRAQEIAHDQQIQLKLLITDDVRGWADIAVEPGDLLTPPTPYYYHREESWDKAFARRPDLQQFRSEVEKQDVIVRFHYNQLFASLDLLGSVGENGVRHDLGGAIADSLVGDSPAFSYGVVLSVPLGNTAARHNYEAMQIARKQA